MKKAIIFDNDGVLVNTEPLYFQATKEMCAELGINLTLDQFIDCHIKSSRATWHLLGLAAEEIPRWRLWRNKRYEELIENSEPLTCVGVEKVIKLLSAEYRLCIVTSSKRNHFDAIHKYSNYLQHFEFIISLEDVKKSKPSPEPYIKAVEKLGLGVEDCLVVEDSYRGLESAKAAGLECILIKNEFSQYQDLRNADKILESIKGLPFAMRKY
jgi:HAD superfamily hydrolase (TIGR01509 family)